ncbi:MAG: M56 family metallopeptidase, partial [Terriglobales bacterium]
MIHGIVLAVEHSSWITALGTALLHLLWQAAVIALLVALAQPTLKRASSTLRYAVALFGLALVPVAFALTLLMAHARSALALAWLPQALARLPEFLPWLVAVWAVGVLLFGLQALGGWCLLRRLRREVRPPAAWLAQQFTALCRRAGMEARAQLALSAETSTPCALGFWRPLVLLPVSALTTLAPDQLEAILAHELAHIRRCDYLINLFQRALEVVFFYHPAVWWLSRQVAQEREHCCDDAAIALCGDRGVYAHALLALAAPQAPVLTVAAVGGSLP